MATRVDRAVVLTAMLAVVSGCTSAASPEPSPSDPGESGSALRVIADIDLGGAEAYGLAIHRDGVWAISYQAGTLSRIDPATGELTTTVRLPHAASALATDDAVWVVGYGGGPADSVLYRIDPATGQTVATIATGEVCCDLTIGDGSVWALDPGGAVLRIDAATNRVVSRLPVTVDRSVHANLVFAGGAVWVASDSTKLFRLDPASGAIRDIDVGGGVPFVARDGLLWGASPNRLWAVNEQTGALVRDVSLPDSIEVISLELGLGAIWVGIRHPGRIGALLRLDPSSGAVVDELRIDIPARIGIGFGSVWVTDSGSSSLYRINVP